MTTLTIENLERHRCFDNSALRAIIGAGLVCRRFVGSTITAWTPWRYTGRVTRRFLGNVYLSGKGWARKYRASYQYMRCQFKYNHYDDFYQ
ncbi:hypothetical protein [Thiosocius teredinicola]|uniref:hypothetical protein n=1 Tax=Thiosocius teredinicola TaxID=1973002 RepID=UPI000991319E